MLKYCSRLTTSEIDIYFLSFPSNPFYKDYKKIVNMVLDSCISD